MIIGRIKFSGLVPFALLSQNVNEHRSSDILCRIKRLDEVVHVMSVNRTVIVKTKIFKHGRFLAVQKESEEILDRKDYLDKASSQKSQFTQERFRCLLCGNVSARDSELGKML